MPLRSMILLLPLQALSLAQPAETISNQKLIGEMKEMRALLERLGQTVSTLERGQKGQLALSRIQIDEYRVATLEAQRLQLVTREQELSKEAAEAGAFSRTEESGGGQMLVAAPDGTTQIVSRQAAGTATARLTQANRSLERVRKSRVEIEQQIAVYRARIEKMEQYLEEAMR